MVGLNLISFDFGTHLPRFSSPEGKREDPYTIVEVRIGTGGTGVTDSLKLCCVFYFHLKTYCGTSSETIQSIFSNSVVVESQIMLQST